MASASQRVVASLHVMQQHGHAKHDDAMTAHAWGKTTEEVRCMDFKALTATKPLPLNLNQLYYAQHGTLGYL
jgi:hypothetical protein